MNVAILIAGIAVFLLTIGAGIYAQEYGKAEMVHFRVAVPAGTITELTQVKAGGQPVEMAPLSINLVQRGFLKNMLNANIEGISTHGIVNAGKKPLRIRMEMVNSTVPVRWEVKANHAYDPASQTFTDLLMPGKSIENLAIDWFFEIPPDKIHDPVIYDGGLRFTDADTGEELTFLPVRIANGDLPSDAVAGTCH